MKDDVDGWRPAAGSTDATGAARTIMTRNAVLSDHVAIASLLRQLGYAVSQTRIHDKLQTLVSSSSDTVLVATIDHLVIGCISLHALPLFHADGSLGRITSMIVDERHRGTGAGRALMTAAEHWFRSVGCVKCEVTSGDHRTDAHRFYEKQGFVRDGQRLSKTTAPP